MKADPESESDAGEHFLVADVGGTNARFALAPAGAAGGGEAVIESLEVYRCDAFESFNAAMRSYREALGSAFPKSACIAIAGPVDGCSVEMTNRGWRVGEDELRREFGFETVQLVNDAEAIAAGIKTIGEADLLQLKAGVAADGPALVITAGTGLGVGALLPAADAWQALPTEAGHLALVPRSDLQRSVIDRLRAEHGRVSAEFLLSGPGIGRLYRALATIEGSDARLDDSEAITAAAVSGTDALSARSIELFRSLLGNFAGELALAFGARGGVYLAGGIFRRLAPLLCDDVEFAASFCDKGPMQRFVKAIPVWLATVPKLGLRGARLTLERRMAERNTG